MIAWSSTTSPLWALVMPLTSLVLISRIPGTIPAYMLAFASPIFCSATKVLFDAGLRSPCSATCVFAVGQSGGAFRTSNDRGFMSLSLNGRSEIPSPTFPVNDSLRSRCISLQRFSSFLFVKTHYQTSA